jgi:reverse gyrase
MRKLVLSSLLLLIALDAFGHAGEVHKYMGTVTAVNADGSFTLEKTDGAKVAVHVSNATTYTQADGRSAQRSDLTAGKRVVVTISKDGHTASEVKLAAAKKMSGK